MAHDVFISYSSKDKATADAVCATLESHGIRCWIAPRDILPGMEYAEALVEAIQSSRLVVLVFSSRANDSIQVHQEVERAVSHGLPILPFRIEDVSPSPAMELFISGRHWLDALTPPLESHLQHLAKTTKLLLSRLSSAEAEPGPRPVDSGPTTRQPVDSGPGTPDAAAGNAGPLPRTQAFVDGAIQAADLGRGHRFDDSPAFRQSPEDVAWVMASGKRDSSFLRPTSPRHRLNRVVAAAASVVVAGALAYGTVLILATGQQSLKQTPASDPPGSRDHGLEWPLSSRDALFRYEYEMGWSGAPQGKADAAFSRYRVTKVEFEANNAVRIELARPTYIWATMGARTLTGTWNDEDGKGDIELQFNEDFSRAEGWWSYGGMTQKYNAFLSRVE